MYRKKCHVCKVETVETNAKKNVDWGWNVAGDKRGAHKCLCNVDVYRPLYKEILVITANEAYSAALFELEQNFFYLFFTQFMFLFCRHFPSLNNK